MDAGLIQRNALHGPITTSREKKKEKTHLAMSVETSIDLFSDFELIEHYNISILDFLAMSENEKMILLEGVVRIKEKIIRKQKEASSKNKANYG